MVSLQNRGGYTLIEVLMVTAIIGVVALQGPELFKQITRFVLLQTAKIEIQREARVALDLINRSLRQAQATTVIVDQVSGQPPMSRISFSDINGNSKMFYQSGHQLYQVYRSTVPICKNLRYIAFTYPRTDDPTIIAVAITTEKGTYNAQTKALELSIEKVRIMN